jgi:hypothetical protein
MGLLPRTALHSDSEHYFLCFSFFCLADLLVLLFEVVFVIFPICNIVPVPSPVIVHRCDSQRRRGPPHTA